MMKDDTENHTFNLNFQRSTLRSNIQPESEPVVDVISDRLRLAPVVRVRRQPRSVALPYAPTVLLVVVVVVVVTVMFLVRSVAVVLMLVHQTGELILHL